MEQTLLVIALIAICAFALRAPKLFKSKDPVQIAPAEVISRRCVMPDSSYSNFRGSKMRYFVAFKINEETKELTVTSTQYTHLLEGTQGNLTWQGNTFVDFQ